MQHRSPKITILLVFILTFAATGLARDLPTNTFPEVRVEPVDEAGRKPEFKQFRDRLLRAVQEKDVAFVLEHIATDIKVGFGGANGIDDFIDIWQLEENPKESRLWQELRDVLRLGGVWKDQEFLAPYPFTEFPHRPEFDPYEFAVVTGSNVNVRAQPSIAAPSIGQATYLVVKRHTVPRDEQATDTFNGDTYPWEKITLPNGATGYLWGKYLRSPLDYRAAFKKIDGAYRLTHLLAGD